MDSNRRRFIYQSGALAFGALYAPVIAQTVDGLMLDESPNPLFIPKPHTGDGIQVASGRINVWPNSPSDRVVVSGSRLIYLEYERGSNVSLPVTNSYVSPITIHWHGLDVPADVDGHPLNAISPGTTKQHSFPLKNRAGLYFFHSHSHMATAREVYSGLVGLFIVRDDEERALNLPSGEYEIPIIIQDVRVDALGQIVYAPSMNDMMNGWMGNRVLANGTPNAVHSVKRGSYRLRLVNGSNARAYLLQLSNKQPFTIIGVDGGLNERPHSVNSIMLAPAERLDVVIDFSNSEPGTDVRLTSAPYTAPAEMMAPLYPQGIALDIVTFRVGSDSAPRYAVPETLCTLAPIPNVQSLPVRTFVLAMSRGMGMGMRPTINGKTYDINRSDFSVNANSSEVWEFKNTEGGMFHPMHIHGRQFRILSRSGSSLLPTDQGLKDTVLVNPNETIRVFIQHSEYEGLFLFHCHNLEHEDEGMMQNYTIVRATGIADQTEEPLQVSPNPASSTITVARGEKTIDILTIYSANGEIVERQIANESRPRLSVAHLSPGIYWISDGTDVVKFAVLR